MRVLQQSGDLTAASEHAVPLAEIAARTGDPGLLEMASRLNAQQERHTRGMTAEMLGSQPAASRLYLSHVIRVFWLRRCSALIHRRLSS